MRTCRKVFVSLMAVVMVLSAMSATVFADSYTKAEGQNEFFDWEYNSHDQLIIDCKCNSI